MKHLVALMGFVLLLTSCTKHTYVITGEIAENDYNGKNVCLYSYDRRAYVDTALIMDSKFVFKGKSSVHEACCLRISGTGVFIDFILEPGKIHVSVPLKEDYENPEREDRIMICGTPWNDSLDLLNDQIDQYVRGCKLYRKIINSDTTIDGKVKRERYRVYKEQASQELKQIMIGHFYENVDDILGAYLFVRGYNSGLFSGEEYDIYYPMLGESVRHYATIEKVTMMRQAVLNTSEGKSYMDFTIENGSIEGQAVSLSDYVGKDGKYLLVVFWASWCDYCYKDVPKLKKLYQKYRDRVEFLGVAVLDDSFDSKQSISNWEMTWPQILEAGMIPCDMYGFKKIPFMMLIDPQGTIVGRDLRPSRFKCILESLHQ